MAPILTKIINTKTINIGTEIIIAVNFFQPNLRSAFFVFVKLVLRINRNQFWNEECQINLLVRRTQVYIRFQGT